MCAVGLSKKVSETKLSDGLCLHCKKNKAFVGQSKPRIDFKEYPQFAKVQRETQNYHSQCCQSFVFG
jgi:hypothetical protein